MKNKNKYIYEISGSLLGCGGLACFQRAAKVIEDCRYYNDENFSSLREMLSGYEGMAMASALWPWEGRLAETVEKKKEQFIEVMSHFGVTSDEIAVLLEGNPRYNK